LVFTEFFVTTVVGFSDYASVDLLCLFFDVGAAVGDEFFGFLLRKIRDFIGRWSELQHGCLRLGLRFS
jgi:hypothetical protein